MMDGFSEHRKCVVIQTPAAGIYFILTRPEAKRFAAILEETDNEAKALSLICLFDA
jgi:hypothetical protein